MNKSAMILSAFENTPSLTHHVNKSSRWAE